MKSNTKSSSFAFEDPRCDVYNNSICLINFFCYINNILRISIQIQIINLKDAIALSVK